MPENDIELTVQYDSDQRSYLFDESIATVEDPTARCDHVYEYIDCGNITPIDGTLTDLYHLDEITTEKVFAALFDEVKKDYPGFDGMRRFIKESCIADHPKEALTDHLQHHYSIGDFMVDKVTLADEIGAKSKFHRITTTGYCQGDHAIVLVNIAAYEKLSGRKFDAKAVASLQTTIDHLFWDSPIHARLSFNLEEIFLDEMLSDPYRWEPDEIKKGLKGYHPSIIKYIEENLPSELAYN
jgi:hypothetical protein